MAGDGRRDRPAHRESGLKERFGELREAARGLHAGSEAIIRALHELDTCDALRRMRELSARAGRH